MLIQTEVGRAEVVAKQLAGLPGCCRRSTSPARTTSWCASAPTTLTDCRPTVVPSVQQVAGITRTLTCPIAAERDPRVALVDPRPTTARRPAPGTADRRDRRRGRARSSPCSSSRCCSRPAAQQRPGSRSHRCPHRSRQPRMHGADGRAARAARRLPARTRGRPRTGRAPRRGERSPEPSR